MTTPTAVDREALRLGAFMPPWLLPLDIDPTRAIRGQLETVEYLERIGFAEAWIGEHHSGGVEIISSPELFIAAAIERTSRIRLGTGRHLAAVPQPAHGGRPRRPARPPGPGPRDVRLRAGPAAVRRDDARHPEHRAARSPHRGAGRRAAAPRRRGRHAELGVVRAAGRAAAPRPAHPPAARDRRRERDHAVRRDDRGALRRRDALRRRVDRARLRRPRRQLEGRQRRRRRARPRHGPLGAAPRGSGARRRDARPGDRGDHRRLPPLGLAHARRHRGRRRDPRPRQHGAAAGGRRDRRQHRRRRRVAGELLGEVRRLRRASSTS